MALPPLADVDALSDWVGEYISDARPRAEAVLSAASALVRAETGQTWVDDNDALTAVPDEVAVVVVQAAARVWFNPAGLESATIDDATRRWPTGSTQGLYLTDSERSLLSRYRSGGTPNGLGVLSTTRGELSDDTVYVPTGPPPAGYPFPWYDANDPAVFG